MAFGRRSAIGAHADGGFGFAAKPLSAGGDAADDVVVERVPVAVNVGSQLSW